MNLILCPKGKSEIFYFIKNAVKRGNDVYGDNIKLTGVKDKTWDFIWTEDEVKEKVVDGDKKGFESARDDVSVIETNIDIIDQITKDDVKNLMALSRSDKELDSKEVDFCIKALSSIILAELKLGDKK